MVCRTSPENRRAGPTELAARDRPCSHANPAPLSRGKRPRGCPIAALRLCWRRRGLQV